MSRPCVVVTGASRGIGAAVAIGAARDGFDVVVNYRTDQAAADQVMAKVRAQGASGLVVKADVSIEKQVVSLFEAVDQKFGRLDALVNNAGILAPAQPLAEYTAERMQRIFDTNILGAFLAAREAVKRMSKTSGGSGGVIVNMSSVTARTGGPNEYVDYAASKGAVDSMTTGLALEVAGQGIRVNSVRPGLIYTEIHASGGRPDRIEQLKHTVPMGRGGTAEEVADTVSWLLSDRASYVTGACIDVGGGR